MIFIYNSSDDAFNDDILVDLDIIDENDVNEAGDNKVQSDLVARAWTSLYLLFFLLIIISSFQ